MAYYLDQSSSAEEVVRSEEEAYPGQSEKYNHRAKNIRFRALVQLRKQSTAKVISIAQASSRLKELSNNTNIFSIFKRHVEQHGLAANYRNFDKMTEQEMKSILEQINLTELFDEISKNLDSE